MSAIEKKESDPVGESPISVPPVIGVVGLLMGQSQNQEGAASVASKGQVGENGIDLKSFLQRWIDNARNESFFLTSREKKEAYGAVFKSCIDLLVSFGSGLDGKSFNATVKACTDYLERYSNEKNDRKIEKVKELLAVLQPLNKDSEGLKGPQTESGYNIRSIREAFINMFRYKNNEDKNLKELYDQASIIYSYYMASKNFEKVFTPVECMDLYKALINLHDSCNAFFKITGLLPYVVALREQVLFMLNNIENAFRGRLDQKDGRLITNFCSRKGYISLMELLGNGEDISDENHFEGDYVELWRDFYKTELKIFKEDLFDVIIKSFSNINAEDTFVELFGKEGNAFRLFIVSMADSLNRLKAFQGFETFSDHYDIELKRVQRLVGQVYKSISVTNWYDFYKKNKTTLFWSVGPAALLMIEKLMKLMMFYNGDIAKYNAKQWSTGKTESVGFRKSGESDADFGDACDGWEKLTFVVEREDDGDPSPENTCSLAEALVENRRQEREKMERLAQALKTSSSSSSSAVLKEDDDDDDLLKSDSD